MRLVLKSHMDKPVEEKELLARNTLKLHKKKWPALACFHSYLENEDVLALL